MSMSRPTARCGHSANGAPTAFVYLSKVSAANGSTGYVYRVVTPGGNLRMTTSFNADGKIDGIFFAPM